jgi:uncharacterized membrane protein YsdA (DUF1294 family)
MNAVRVVGFVLAACSAIPVFILFLVCGNLRRELSKAGIREPELTLQVLSGLGGVNGFLLVFRLDPGLDRRRAVSRLVFA